MKNTSRIILAVDDSLTMRELVKASLEDGGYNVLVAEDGKEALGLLHQNSVDLVVTDLNMPVMDGLELTKSIRSGTSHQYVPILFLSTESKVEIKQKAKEAGATGWIVKPFEKESLLKVIKRVVG